MMSMGTLQQLADRIAAHGPGTVVMLVGAPGSGKSTAAAALAARLHGDVAVLSYAAHREEVTGDPADPAGDPRAGQLLRDRLTTRCAGRLTTVVDGTHHLARSRARIAAIAADAGVPAIAVVLNTPLGLCLARQETRPVPAPGRRHSLRVPDEQVRALDRAVRAARGGLVDEGFVVYELDADTTTTAQPDAWSRWSAGSSGR